MIDRDKLIALLKIQIYPRIDADPAEVLADYLIDNYQKYMQKAKWIMIDKNGNGICSFCNRQDRVDSLAISCRYCGCQIEF